MTPWRFLHGLRFGVVVAQNDLFMVNLELMPFRWELWVRFFGNTDISIQVGPISLFLSNLAQFHRDVGPCERP